MRLLVRAAFVMLLVALPFGCGKGGPAVVAVSGRVTLDKKPLPNAVVRFHPTNPAGDGKTVPDSYGTTDDQGNYTLKAVLEKGDADGAVAGQHTVYISVFDRDARPPRELLPAKYSSKGDLTFTVPPAGTKDANFDLTSK